MLTGVVGGLAGYRGLIGGFKMKRRNKETKVLVETDCSDFYHQQQVTKTRAGGAIQ